MAQKETPLHMTLETGEGHLIRIYESWPHFSHRHYFAHKHSAFEISYVKSGSGRYRIEEEDCLFRAGDVFVFGTNEVHCITDVDADAPLILYNLQFEPRLLWSPRGYGQNQACIDIFTHRGAGAGSRLNADSPTTGRVVRLLLEIFQEAERQERAYEMMIEALLMQILSELVRGLGGEEDRVELFAHKSRLVSMERAMTYIEDNLAKKLTLEDIAREAGLSRTYFSTLFRSLNGLSPWDYILIRRVENAKHLLSTTELPVLEVCGEVGFENVSHFNRVFRRLTGRSPRDYRTSHRN